MKHKIMAGAALKKQAIERTTKHIFMEEQFQSDLRRALMNTNNLTVEEYFSDEKRRLLQLRGEI